MGFIESYKRLEKLCGEILNDDRRISAYIEEMERTSRGSGLVPLWNNDLKQLKHYRWVRNQIAHEPNCTESNMCQPGDAAWLDHFYSRIMHQTDPLALYAQAVKPRPSQKQTRTGKPFSDPNVRTSGNVCTPTEQQNPPAPSKMGCLSSLVIALTVMALIVFIWLAVLDLSGRLF